MAGRTVLTAIVFGLTVSGTGPARRLADAWIERRARGD
jgi:hypothetical protein